MAVNRSRYVPGLLKVTSVTGEPGLAKVAPPGPATLLQVVVSLSASGEVSFTEPFSVALLFGKVIVWFGPASTVRSLVGGVVTVIVASESVVNCVSLARS